jgi:hypothetical protein
MIPTFLLLVFIFSLNNCFAAYGTKLNLSEYVKKYGTTVPFTTQEGVAGGGLVPFALLSGTKPWPFQSDPKPITKPHLGMWWITLPSADLNWISTGFNFTVFDRIEFGFANNYINIDEPFVAKQVGLDLDTDMFDISTKIQLIKESTYIPSVSVGMIYKHTNFDTPESFKKMGGKLYSNNSGFDFYAVATKLVFIPLPLFFPLPNPPMENMDCLPVPLLLNFGVKSTKSAQFGVTGFGNDRDAVFFGSAELVIAPDIFLDWDFLKGSLIYFGGEYVEGYDTGSNVIDGINDKLKTDRMWDLNLIFDTGKNLSVILAYLNTGDNNLQSNLEKMDNPSSMGKGFVLSLQYQF